MGPSAIVAMWGMKPANPTAAVFSVSLTDFHVKINGAVAQNIIASNTNKVIGERAKSTTRNHFDYIPMDLRSEEQ